MRFLITAAFVFAMVGMLFDNYSTYHALTFFADETIEANPLARWIFGVLGLAPGLVVSGIMATALYTYIAKGALIQRASTRLFVLLGVGGVRMYAGVSNFGIITTLTYFGGS